MKSILALLLLPITAWAASDYDYRNNGDSYQLLESSVTREMSDNDFTVSAIWEVTTPKNSWRWVVQAHQCNGKFGLVTIYGEGSVNNYAWSSEGRRAYDYLAVATCTSYFFPTKPKNK